jgi:hypothetical protein
MAQNVETLSFFERFQRPISRRALMRTVCVAASAAVVAVVPGFLKGAPPEAQAQPTQEPKQKARLAARQKALAMRHPGPRW